MSDRPQDPTSLELLVRIADALDRFWKVRQDDVDARDATAHASVQELVERTRNDR